MELDMKHRWSRRGALATAIAGVLLSGVATADDVANLSVTANVAPSCQLSAAPTLAFGTLNPLANNDAQGNITWVCTNGFNTVIRLGGGSSGNINGRTMGGAGTLPYQLYTNAARTIVFGDGTTGSTVPVAGVGYGSPATVTVYGRVLQANAAVATNGNYSDTVQVTIVF
jgi:spore coat protein U domain-containing protein, fimbrial subunit CupE1/2/3/6